MKNASVPPDTLWGMILYSVRYAMGRRSCAPGEACDWVRGYQDYLTPHQVEQIAREVNEELARCEARGSRLGDECDHRTWMTLVADLRKSAQTRRSGG